MPVIRFPRGARERTRWVSPLSLWRSETLLQRLFAISCLRAHGSTICYCRFAGWQAAYDTRRLPATACSVSLRCQAPEPLEERETPTKAFYDPLLEGAWEYCLLLSFL